MRASFPTQIDCVLLGKSREAGEFEREAGVKISYGDAVDLAFESSDGLSQTCRVTVEALDKAADFDVLKTPKLTQLRVVGDVNIRDDGGSFRPTKVTKLGA